MGKSNATSTASSYLCRGRDLSRCAPNRLPTSSRRSRGDISPGSTNTFAEGPFIGDSLAEPTLVYNDNTSIDVLVTVDETGKYLLAEGDFAR